MRKKKGGIVDERQLKSFNYFVENAKEIERKYKGKFVVIKDETILGGYDTFADAVKQTITQGHEPGTFIVQEANADPSSYTATYYNSKFFKVG